MEMEEEITERKELKSGAKHYGILLMIAIVLALTIFQSFQIQALKNEAPTAGVVTGAASGVDMSGWTEDEKMMYDHHGTLPARLNKGASAASSGGMVGGC